MVDDYVLAPIKMRCIVHIYHHVQLPKYKQLMVVGDHMVNGVNAVSHAQVAIVYVSVNAMILNHKMRA